MIFSLSGDDEPVCVKCIDTHQIRIMMFSPMCCLSSAVVHHPTLTFSVYKPHTHSHPSPLLLGKPIPTQHSYLTVLYSHKIQADNLIMCQHVWWMAPELKQLIFTFNNEINENIHLGFYQYYRGYYNTGTNDDKTFTELRAWLGGVCGWGWRRQTQLWSDI